MQVVRAIADIEGVAPEDLDFRLYDVIDPDALDALAEHSNGWKIEFVANGHDVLVTGDGRIVVDGTEVRSP